MRKVYIVIDHVKYDEGVEAALITSVFTSKKLADSYILTYSSSNFNLEIVCMRLNQALELSENEY